MTQIRPMLAAQKYRAPGDLWGSAHEAIVAAELEREGYLLMQPKIDGMRCMFHESVAKSRSWKPLSNRALQTFASEYGRILEGLDAEVISGHAYDPNVFRQSMSGIRSADGSPEFTLYAFDNFQLNGKIYEERRYHIEQFVERYGGTTSCDSYSAKVVLCPQINVHSLDEIYAEEARLLADGWEGGIIRHPRRPYKFGRSTALGMELVKVKRREYVDAIVTGYEPRYENQNEATQSALGYTTRSSHQENLVPLDMLGVLHIKLVESGIEQKVGVFRGLSHTDLRDLWGIRDTLPGRHCEVSVDKAAGGYERCRTPVWIRWRDAAEF